LLEQAERERGEDMRALESLRRSLEHLQHRHGGSSSPRPQRVS
jgi:hypothetical protein